MALCFKSNWTIFSFVLVISVLIMFINFSMVSKVYPRNVISSLEQFITTGLLREDADTKTILTTELVQQITDIAKSIHRAKIHVRGTKTSDALRQALTSMDTFLDTLNINRTNIFARAVKSPVNVCPEKYMGPKFGWPLYEKGFEVTNCSFKKPLSRLVTVLANFKDRNATQIQNHLHSFRKFSNNNQNVSMIIAVQSIYPLEVKPTEHIKLLNDYKNASDGDVWNKLVSTVKTPYVLIARDIELLTEDARIERLVREIESLQVPVAAGAIRYPDGHWTKGCYQSVHKNFTLRYLEGYDESFHECLFCDYSLGPFVISVETIKEYPFSSYSGEILFEDLFLRLKYKNKETIVCPDSMYHVMHNTNNDSLKKFMLDWQLYKTVSPSGEETLLDCAKDLPAKQKSRALSPCLLNKNAEAVVSIMTICAEIGVVCELNEGTCLGAVKFGKVLPWEWDADIKFPPAHYERLRKISKTFDRKGFSVMKTPDENAFCLGYPGWVIDMYGIPLLDYNMLRGSGINRTQALLDGTWVYVARNPGLAMRNHYGHEIYQHAIHWRFTNATNGLAPYKTNVFPRCDVQGNHACLDRYNADGNLPFTEPLP